MGGRSVFGCVVMSFVVLKVQNITSTVVVPGVGVSSTGRFAGKQVLALFMSSATGGVLFGVAHFENQRKPFRKSASTVLKSYEV